MCFWQGRKCGEGRGRTEGLFKPDYFSLLFNLLGTRKEKSRNPSQEINLPCYGRTSSNSSVPVRKFNVLLFIQRVSRPHFITTKQSQDSSRLYYKTIISRKIQAVCVGVPNFGVPQGAGEILNPKVHHCLTIR